MNTLVLEETEIGEIPVDVYQKMANDRILFISNYIDERVASSIVATLILKDHEDPDLKTTLFINSPGGNIRDVLMIYDIMKILSSPVEIVCVGACMQEATLLLAGGTPGMRLATKNSIITIGQLVPNWHTSTNMTDGNNLMKLLKIDNDRLLDIYSKALNKPVKQLKQELDRESFFTATKAVKYGLIDKVVAFNK